MTNANDQFGQLAARLSRLERQNRWWKLGALSIAVIAGFGVMLGAAPTEGPKVIETESFIMRDTKGVARVEIGKDGFYVNDDNGKHRIAFYAHAGKDGETGIRLIADDDSKKQVTIFVKNNPDSPSGLHINDSNGKTRVMTGIGGIVPNEKPFLTLQDENQKGVFFQSQP